MCIGTIVGKIGAITGNILMGFGCKIVAYDMHPNKELKDKGWEYVTLPELYSRSDVISLHCPLTKDTRYMINKNAISQMKPGLLV